MLDKFVWLIVHFWMFFHTYGHHIFHATPKSYHWHMRMLHRQITWLFRHISGNV